MGTARAAAAGGTASRDARVEAMLRDHRATLLWVARRWTGSTDEADDALQRAMEIYVRRLDSIDAASELAWLKVVVRHEAIAMRRARFHGVPLDADDVAEHIAAPDAAVQERIEREEHSARSLEALAQLKPDERTALLMKAEGYSYREIGERQGWTYTKVNRAITEGRRRFLRVFASIEAGDECERFAPTLLALAEGGAESSDVVALRPHLRHCASCRATVRELHASRRHRLLLHIPPLAGIAPLRWLGDRVADAPEERVAALGRGPDVKGVVHGLLHRITGPDAVTSIQLASGGGGRGPAVAALLGLCLSGGAGTYCLATGALPDPGRLVQRGDKPEHARKAGAGKQTKRNIEPSRTAAPASSGADPPLRPVVVATSTPAPQLKKSEKTPHKKPDKSPDPRDEFGFEGVTGSAEPPPSPSGTGTTATTSSAAPAPAQRSGGGSTPSSSPPPTSGGEFMP